MIWGIPIFGNLRIIRRMKCMGTPQTKCGYLGDLDNLASLLSAERKGNNANVIVAVSKIQISSLKMAFWIMA